MPDSSSSSDSASGQAPSPALVLRSSDAAVLPQRHPAPPRRLPQPPPLEEELPDGSPPPPSVLPFLKSALRASAFLQGLRDEELHVSGRDLSELASRARAVHFSPGSVLIEQGSKHTTPGSTPLYIVHRGPSGVYVSKKRQHGGAAVRVGSVAEGEIVGDMSLYTDSPPSVSVRSEGQVLAWRIDKAAFDDWIKSRPAVANSLSQRRWLWGALARNYLFADLDDDLAKEELLSRFEPSFAEAGQPIVQYGEQGDRFYVIKSGRCSVEVPVLTGHGAAAADESDKEKEKEEKDQAASPSKKRRFPEEQAESDEEDVFASGKTGHAGKLVPKLQMSEQERGKALLKLASGEPWSGVNPLAPQLPMVKVAELKEGNGFGEISLQFGVPRCATVKCISPSGCHLWSVDAHSFLTCAARGSLYLKHIFAENASVIDPRNGEQLMNREDFFAAIKHTKWTERARKAKERGIAPDEKDAANPSLTESSLRLMFHLADQSGDNLISFGEFVLLYGILQSPMAKFQLAFQLFDKDHDGFISKPEFVQVVRSLSSDEGEASKSDPQLLRNLSKDPLVVELFGPDEKGVAPKKLTYAEFESLLSRDVLPSFLAGVARDLREVHNYWSSVGEALNVGAIGEGLMSGSALSAANAPKGGVGSSISWKSLVAGGVAGAVSRTLVSPFERLKLLFQMQDPKNPKYTGVIQGLRRIHFEDGIKGYFRGNLSNVVRITPASAFQFFFYDCFKKLFFGDRKDLNVGERLLAGGMAGMTAQAITYPLDFIRARLTLQGGSSVAYRGITHGLVTVVNQSGVLGLYKGLWPSLVGVFPYIGIDFAVYETLRTHLPASCKNEKGDTSRTALFACGATAGIVGQTFAYPLDLIRRRMQVQGFQDTRYNYQGGILRTMQQIVKEEGIKGLYKGMIPNVSRGTHSSAP